jgi:hypothetical protein
MIQCDVSNIGCETGGRLKPPDVIRCRLGGSHIKVIEGNGGPENPDTAKAIGAITNAEKLIGHGGRGSLTMTEAGADSLLIYGFTAMTAHLLMSLGQTLFHRYLGHSRLGGRFSGIRAQMGPNPLRGGRLFRPQLLHIVL